MKRYLLFIPLLFILSLQSFGTNSVTITNLSGGSYNYGSGLNLNLTITLVPDEFTTKKPNKIEVRIPVPANISWSPSTDNISISVSTGILKSNISFSSNTIVFDLTNLYNGQNPQSTTFGLTVNGLVIATPANPVCTDVNAQITGTLVFYDDLNNVITPSTAVGQGTYSFTILKSPLNVDLVYYYSNASDYAGGNDVYFVDFYYNVTGTNVPFTGVKFTLSSNQQILKVGIVDGNNFITGVNSDDNTADNVYTFQTAYTTYQQFRVYIKNTIISSGTATLNLTTKIDLTGGNYCTQPSVTQPYNTSFPAYTGTVDLDSYPRTHALAQSIDMCYPNYSIPFQIDNTYNSLNTNSYVEIDIPANVEVHSMSFSAPNTISSVQVVTCNGTTPVTLPISGNAVDFTSVKANVSMILLNFASGVAASSFTTGSISYQYNATKVCGTSNFVFNIKNTGNTSVPITSKLFSLSIQQTATPPPIYIGVSPGSNTIVPNQPYAYYAYLYPDLNVTESWQYIFTLTDHLVFDKSNPPLFSINGNTYLPLAQANAASSTHFTYSYLPTGNQFLLSGVNLPPLLQNCSYSQPYIYVQIPVKGAFRPISGDQTGTVKLYNASNVNVQTNTYTTTFNDTPKINGSIAVSCDEGVLSDAEVTIKNNDAFSVIAVMANGSGQSYTGASAVVTVDLPKTGVTYSSVFANLFDENNVQQGSNITPTDVSYLDNSNNSSATLTPSSTKVVLTFGGLNINGYGQFKLFLDFPSNKSYVTNNALHFNSTVAGLLVISNNAQVIVGPKSDCDVADCADCVTSFSPIPGQTYFVSAWVKESYDATATPPATYVHSGVKINFNNNAITNIALFQASGPIVDGWQRIEGTFKVPGTAQNIQILLVNDHAGYDVFFDDIRIHPLNSNMKSFVYNPSTQKLVAELDENNFATLYEYDDEGILVRVKKETERGVMTIKETRSNQSKVQTNKAQD